MLTLDQIRQELPAVQRTAYLNTGVEWPPPGGGGRGVGRATRSGTERGPHRSDGLAGIL